MSDSEFPSKSPFTKTPYIKEVESQFLHPQNRPAEPLRRKTARGNAQVALEAVEQAAFLLDSYPANPEYQEIRNLLETAVDELRSGNF